jgi:hypothetical protein
MNNGQIDNTDYYRLPCGKYLEDFIWHRRLSFAEGSALKYRWRKGRKDGEAAVKDEGKCMHFCRFLTSSGRFRRVEDASKHVDALVAEAKAWHGLDYGGMAET